MGSVPPGRCDREGAAAAYQFECADTGRVWQVAGRQLMDEGLPIALATPRSSCVLYYQEAT